MVGLIMVKAGLTAIGFDGLRVIFRPPVARTPAKD